MGEYTYSEVNDVGLYDLSAADAGSIARRILSGLDLDAWQEHLLERIAEAPTNSFISVNEDYIRSQVSNLRTQLKSGEVLPLAGVPIAIKDNIDVRGLPLTAGHKRIGFDPRSESVIVARLREAGCIVVGKANMHELALGATGFNPHFGTVANPAFPTLDAGGSSSGSAALVAARTVPFAVGTDSGGSVRMPAACCGVFGLRPTRGAVPLTGTVPLSWLHDTVGPLTRSVGDLALSMLHMSGADGMDPVSLDPPKGWRTALTQVFADVPGPMAKKILVPMEFWDGGETGLEIDWVWEAVLSLADRCGAEVEKISLEGVSDARRAHGTLLDAYALAEHGARALSAPEEFGADVLGRLQNAEARSGTDVVNALRVRDVWAYQLRTLLVPGVLIATPTMPRLPPTRSEVQDSYDTDALFSLHREMNANVGVWGMAGVPALSVPCRGKGQSSPASIQLIAGPWQEPLLLESARSAELG